ncbi:MAG TPA: DUF5606 domain-containing protein [Bacteroidales bacterium]|nr:DUF5606 domain-containing protein [Bacteroidales bacterium]HRW95281.1 DUF5606 domain-containing protein [Bacteroidales bacterium]
MKTDLTKILSVGGHPGLYLYLAQSNGGVVVESMTDKTRKWMGPSARMTSLSDISVYTTMEDELKLQDVFTKMKDFLKDDPAPDPKSSAPEMAEFFEKVIPQYDKDRFYASHMKKVLDWYNILKTADALDFENPEMNESVDNTDKSESESKVSVAKAAKTAKTSKPAGTKAPKTTGAKAPKPVMKHTTQK